MIDAIEAPANVFLITVAPAAGVAPGELERGLVARAAALSLPSRPELDPGLFSHRILRGVGGYLWEITFEGRDLPPGEPSLADAVREAAAEPLAGLGAIVAFVAYVDLSLPPPGPDFVRPEGSLSSFSDDGGEPGWEDHAADSGAPEAGTALPDELLTEIQQGRAAAPAEPNLKKWGSGYIYGGGTDHDHFAYIKAYLDARAAQASPGDRRKILAFRAFQAREGSTAAINTYDNQIVTWGTGWGGLGWLGTVMEKAVANPCVRDLFGAAGVRYRAKNVYDVVDLDQKRVVTGTREALEAMRSSVPMLNVLIQAARATDTRDAVTEAQLLTFMGGSASFGLADAVATQALFNLITHLKHWAPGYVMGCLEWAVPQAGDGPSEARDHLLAVLVGRYFYGKAHKYKWIPDWKQFQLYWHHLRDDGLDCLSDPFIQASAAPTEDPFAGAPATPPPVPAAPPPSAALLASAPIAGQPDLESAARGKSVIHKGLKGAGVKALQTALIQLGYDVPGGADGVFGGGLEGAVKAFQTAGGLTADGVVGKGTLLALDARLGAATAAAV